MRLLQEYGPFFEVALHDDPPPAPWRPLAELPGSAELADWIGGMQASLGASRRVAASIGQLGLAARLLSPVLAAATRHQVLLDLGTGYWQPPLTSMVALSLSRPSQGAEPAALCRSVTAGPVAELTAAIGRLGSVSHRVLAGNLASAVNGAALQLGPACYPAAAAMLAGVPSERHEAGPGFRRRSCCLRYRLAGAGYCDDCLLG
jgi:FhuF-like iron-sulfur protein